MVFWRRVLLEALLVFLLILFYQHNDTRFFMRFDSICDTKNSAMLLVVTLWYP